MKMNIWVELVDADGEQQTQKIGCVLRDSDHARFQDFGLSLNEGKDLQNRLQQELTQFQTDQAAKMDRRCSACCGLRNIDDYRSRVVDTLFGLCRIRVPRFRACNCDESTNSENGRVQALIAGRVTPELERVQAELGARLSFREAGRVLDLFVPTARPHNHRTVSNRLAKVAQQIEKRNLASPHRMSRTGGSPISVFIDGAYIRAVPGYQSRHFEIVMGRIEAKDRPSRHFAAAPHVAAGKHQIVCAALRAQGWMPGNDVTVFGDGDPALRGAVMTATREPVIHILDWFHLSMRLRHVEQACEGIRTIANLDILLYQAAFHVPRLRHLLWSGYVREAADAVRTMSYQLAWSLWGQMAVEVRLRRFSQLVGDFLTYLTQNGSSIVDYCRRYWSGHPISSSRAETTVNCLVNTRMNKKRQMRWSPMGAQPCASGADGSDRWSSETGHAQSRRLTPSFFPLPRDLLIERTQSGLKRAKSEGKALGRPSTLSEKQKQDVSEYLAKGMSVSATARKFGTSRQTIIRVRDESSCSVRS